MSWGRRKREKRAIDALAGAALEARLNGDMGAEHRAMATLIDDYGIAGVVRAMMGWADTMIAEAYGGRVRGASVQMLYENIRPDGSRDPLHADVDAISYHHRFASRWVMARYHFDHPTMEALFRAADHDGMFPDCVAGVLEVCALGIREAASGRKLVKPVWEFRGEGQ